VFVLNEKVVYPGHGVARVNRIIEKKVAGTVTHFFELVFLHKDMTILVPIKNLSAVGIRRLASYENIDELMEMLSDPTVTPRHSESLVTNWNKRSKEYQGKLRTGNIREICKIYKDLRSIENKKELSFGEKNLLQQTEALLVEEIALVKQVEEETAIEQLRALVCSSLPPKSTGTVRTT
jgi:CarD family transcriptional regulator